MTNTESTQSQENARPPVVVVLGHVDHGKTKLLDTIRKTNVAGKESGGITQHIGAYQVLINNKPITFLDTPGHEAFTAIRSRGAKVADIAILVVAADESVKPQTKEAIKIIQEADIPVIVAINKIDRENANPAKVKQDLAQENVLVEEWGGKVPAVEISAKENRNIKELLDMILLVAEIAELKEDLAPPTKGIIIESHLDKNRGYVATALTQKGILKTGDWITVGTVVGKVKSMENFVGLTMPEARPSDPVLITGWPSAPNIGKEFITSTSRDMAQEIASDNVDLAPLLLFFKEIPSNDPDPKKRILNVIFKTDVSSSLEAIDAALKSIKSDEVGFAVLGHGIGNIGEADVKTALSTKALIVGFRVAVDSSAKKLAEKEGLKIATFDIIYELIENFRKEMGELLEPEISKISLGKLRVLALFKKDGKTQVIGGKVMSGKLVRGALVDAVRGVKAVKIGKLSQLQHNKEDVAEVRESLEAGLRVDLEPNQEIKEGDILDIYQEEKIKKSL